MLDTAGATSSADTAHSSSGASHSERLTAYLCTECGELFTQKRVFTETSRGMQEVENTSVTFIENVAQQNLSCVNIRIGIDMRTCVSSAESVSHRLTSYRDTS